MILADDKTCIILIDTGDIVAGVSCGSVCYIGDIFSYLPADSMGGFISARTHENDFAQTEMLFRFSTVQHGTAGCGYIRGRTNGVYEPRLINALIPGLATSTNGLFTGPMAHPNETDGMLWVVGPHVLWDVVGTLRGHLRGINTIPVNTANIPSYTEFSTITGTGELAGKNFILHRVANNVTWNNVSSLGIGAFETSEVPFSV